ncbi:hypothetical protein BLA3211_00945 [Burkholderia aenigmatica]|uniref:Uncharacterized protein n=1 Tax=Burkholderia aenigmatica TaxID=2015348 RepID=A0A6J5ILJ4_9BURK|nr:hypothetical protein BLA3211_00945 [Burkholderia aenigmatica]
MGQRDYSGQGAVLPATGRSNGAYWQRHRGRPSMVHGLAC